MTEPLISPVSLIVPGMAPPSPVDAGRFEQLCEHPDAQRFIIDGRTHGVKVGADCYTLTDDSAISAHNTVLALRNRAFMAVREASNALHGARKELAGLELMCALLEPGYRAQLSGSDDLSGSDGR